MSDSNTPKALKPKFDCIPAALTELGKRWVLWRYELKDGRFTKIPKQPNRQNASSTNPATWTDFATVRRTYEASPNYFSGVGIVLGPPIKNNGKEVYLIGIDFDHCVEGQKAAPFVKAARDHLNTYMELSPSGTGIRMFVLHDQPIETRKVTVDGCSREIYAKGRYMTVTGRGKGEVRHV